MDHGTVQIIKLIECRGWGGDTDTPHPSALPLARSGIRVVDLSDVDLIRWLREDVILWMDAGPGMLTVVGVLGSNLLANTPTR